MNKEKLAKISIFIALAALILVVIITSIVLYQKQKYLEDLNEKNEIVKPGEDEDKDEEDNKSETMSCLFDFLN
ncbi:MAG: hypothetical protein HFI85_00485 [Clostridia bacterium]|nr:hypothetical protein [Clostridia bacterium]